LNVSRIYCTGVYMGFRYLGGHEN